MFVFDQRGVANQLKLRNRTPTHHWNHLKVVSLALAVAMETADVTRGLVAQQTYAVWYLQENDHMLKLLFLTQYLIPDGHIVVPLAACHVIFIETFN